MHVSVQVIEDFARGGLLPLTVLVEKKKSAISAIPRKLVRAILPANAREHLALWIGLRSLQPPFGHVRFGDLRRLDPISHNFGFDRGLPIDRYYIEHFISAHQSDVRGHVLEVGDDQYTRKFGGKHVDRSDVISLNQGNLNSTIVADLTHADHLASDTFDCILFTETLQHIYDVRAALQTLHRLLKPGGTLLAAFNGIGQIPRHDMERWGDYWRFTDLSASRLFGEIFSQEHVKVETFGNVLSAAGLLYGLAAEELRPAELEYRHPDYQVLIAVRAEKRET